MLLMQTLLQPNTVMFPLLRKSVFQNYKISIINTMIMCEVCEPSGNYSKIVISKTV